MSFAVHSLFRIQYESKIAKHFSVWEYELYIHTPARPESFLICELIWKTHIMEEQNQYALTRRCGFSAASDQSLDFLSRKTLFSLAVKFKNNSRYP